MPNDIDLTTLTAVKNFAGATSSSDDQEIADLITDFSQYVLNRTGRDSFNSIASYVEVYDGNGSFRMFLRNSPIVSVTSLLVNGVALQASAGYGSPGYFIEQSGRSLAIRNGTGTVLLSSYPTGCGAFFSKGIGNIQVSYTAGYKVTPADLEFAARRTVAMAYKRKAWLGLKSKSIGAQGATGTTTYQDWEMEPKDERVIVNYTRAAMV